jgi:plastocyanin
MVLNPDEGWAVVWVSMTRKHILVTVIALALVVALATTALAVVRIRGSGGTWRPARVTIDRGTRVVWRATSGTHTVTAYGGGWRFDQTISPSGDPTASRRFRRLGRYKFRCTIHSTLSGGVCNGMCGRIRVRS